jgi:hypothetical protein
MTMRPYFLVASMTMALLAGSASAQADPATAHDKTPLFELAGSVGLPRYLRAGGNAVTDGAGLRGGDIRTVDSDFHAKDFVFDVVFKFRDQDRAVAMIGIGGPGLDASIGARFHAPKFDDAATLFVAGQKEKKLGKIPKAGLHLCRLEKAGNTLTLSVGSWSDGKFQATATKQIADFAKTGSFLDKENSSLFFHGTATFVGVRLSVDGKVVDPGNQPKAVAAPDFERAPLLKLGALAPLPDWLSAGDNVLMDADSVTEGSLQTVDRNLIDKDFTFDVEYRTRDKDRSTFVVGIGGADGQVAVRVHGPAGGGYSTIAIPGAPETRFGDAVKPGTHVLRLEKRGEILTFGFGNRDQSEFRPIASRTLPNLKQVAPFLAKGTSGLRIENLNSARILGVRLIVDGKAVDPGKMSMPVAVLDFERAPFVKVGGANPLPIWLSAEGNAILDREGISDGTLLSVDRDLVDKDFTFDLEFRFKNKDRSIFVVGIGGKESLLHSRVHGPGFGGYGTFAVPGAEEKRLADFVTAGPHVFRIEKRRDTLTLAIGDIDKGTFRPIGSRTLTNIRKKAPYLAKGDSGIRIVDAKSAWISGVRLIVDGKAVDPGKTPTLVAAPDFEKAPLSKLGGANPLPGWLSASGDAVMDDEGFADGVLQSVDRNLVDKDFTFDLRFRFKDRDQTIFNVGIGGPGGLVHSRVHGPGYGGYGTLTLPETPESRLGDFVTAGPHIFRIEKRGDSLTLAVGDIEKGDFAPIASKTLLGIKQIAPFLLKKHYSGIRIENARSAWIDAVRLIVDGKAVESAKEPTPVAAADFEKGPLAKLGGANPLPSWISSSGVAVMSKEGFDDGILQSLDRNLIEKDFTFDMRFRFRDEARTILQAGIGGSGGSVSSRIHGPGHGSYGTLTIPRTAERRLGEFVTAGPHIFRIEKRGEALTLAFGDIENGQFAPIASKTLPRYKDVAPFLKKGNAGIWIDDSNHAALIDGIRLIVDGKDANTSVAKVEPKAGTTEPAARGLTGRENLIDFKSGKLPSFLRPEKNVKLTANGGLDLKNRMYRTAASDFNKKDFTFDALIRLEEGSRAIALLGIGGSVPEYDSVKFHNSVGTRIHGPGHGGYATLTISGQQENELGRFSAPGQHLFRLQKRGNVLTMAICVNFTDKFSADIEKSIPDLKAVAPFLDDKNSYLFFGADASVEAVRLVIDGEAIETQDPAVQVASGSDAQNLAVTLPARIVAGERLRQALLKGDAARRIRLEAPIAGVEIEPEGMLTWTPTEAQLGAHEFRFHVTAGKEVYLVRRTVEVVAPADAKAVAGDLSKILALYKLPLSAAPQQVVPGQGGKSLLLLDGNELKRLEGNGTTVSETLHLPAKYERLYERADWFVGLSDAKKSLDFLDKKTLAVKRSVQMDYLRRNDLALHPTKAVCYVCVDRGGDNVRDVILVVDERTGDVLEHPRFFGTWCVVAPGGKELYAGYREIFQKGSRLLINPDRIHVVPEYGSFESLMIYDISRPTPRLIRYKDDPGGNGNGLAMSPDGKKLSYLSHVGYPVFSGNIPAWDPTNLDKRPVSYPAKESKASPKSLAYHPTLPIAASITESGVICFQRDTGAVEPDRADLKYPPLGEVKVHRCWFSPDGRNLLFDCESGADRFLRRVRLNLTAAESAALSQE